MVFLIESTFHQQANGIFFSDSDVFFGVNLFSDNAVFWPDKHCAGNHM